MVAGTCMYMWGWGGDGVLAMRCVDVDSWGIEDYSAHRGLHGRLDDLGSGGGNADVGLRDGQHGDGLDGGTDAVHASQEGWRVGDDLVVVKESRQLHKSEKKYNKQYGRSLK